MQGWILRWLLNILAIIITAAIIPHFDLTVWGAIVGSIFLGIVNAIIRPILLLLTLPLNLVTLGLFTFVINGFMLWVTSATVKGFDIHGFGWAILSAVLLSVVSFVISFFVDDKTFGWR
ncbi:phage holin family protein [Syntrophomonas palmitatica]|uniref:phage holin family protein n=1 Tax=Syntrophomonas palmitatica TaxID=402877 RepID=UPI0006D0522E|nr:phage holin family protein [Syntrophomonas palmitatica]